MSKFIFRITGGISNASNPSDICTSILFSGSNIGAKINTGAILLFSVGKSSS